MTGNKTGKNKRHKENKAKHGGGMEKCEAERKKGRKEGKQGGGETERTQ